MNNYVPVYIKNKYNVNIMVDNNKYFIKLSPLVALFGGIKAKIFNNTNMIGQIKTGLSQWVFDTKKMRFKIIINQHIAALIYFYFNLNNDMVDCSINGEMINISATYYVSWLESRCYELQSIDGSRCLAVIPGLAYNSFQVIPYNNEPLIAGLIAMVIDFAMKFQPSIDDSPATF